MRIQLTRDFRKIATSYGLFQNLSGDTAKRLPTTAKLQAKQLRLNRRRHIIRRTTTRTVTSSKSRVRWLTAATRFKSGGTIFAPQRQG